MRFYGGTPTFWRHEVSVADVRRCLEAIPRLRAAEALEMVTRLAVGMGRLKRGAATAIIRDWERQANGGRRPRRRRRGPVDPAVLKRLGIAIKKPEGA